MAAYNDQATSLCSVKIKDLSAAQKIIGQRQADGSIPLVLLPERGFFSITMSVPEGFSALVYKGGRYVGIYPPGFYVHPKWYKINYLVTNQYTVFDTPVKDCPTKDNVRVSIDTILVFKIEDPRTFVLRLGAEKLQLMLQEAQEEAVRGLARDTLLEEVYDLTGRRTDDMKQLMNQKFTQFGVLISNVIITNVVVPPDTAQRWENISWYSTKERDRFVSTTYDKLKADHEREYRETQTDLQSHHDSTKKDFDIMENRMKEEVKIIKAECQAQLEYIKAETDAEVKKIQEQAEKDAGKYHAEKSSRIAHIKAETSNQVAGIEAEASAYCREVKSKAMLEASQYKAKTLTLEADAELKMSSMLKAKRQFELDLKKMEVLKSLIGNKQLMIQGDNGMISNIAPGSGSPFMAGGAFYEKMLLETVHKMSQSMPMSHGDGTVRDRIMKDSVSGISGTKKN